ncbi:MAG TPA: sugar transferase [Bacteroidia bacterium]|nr:sugar transferase [Bacteroidia bacterium]
MKRLFDIIASLIGIIILSPVLLLISLFIVFESGFPILYRQKRVGKDNKDFFLLKFRSMNNGADKKGLLTIGEKDSRITRVGYYLRKYKLDELPQLLNVLTGNMSIVGPRPEVRKYVDLYSDEQKKVLSVKPGITDYASMEYTNENEILAKSTEPEQLYIQEVMPKKLFLNQKYIQEMGLMTDIKIVFRTISKIIS